MLGLFILAGLVGFGLIIGIVVYARLWWLQRKMAKAPDSQYVEAEYTVIDRSRRENRPP